MKEKYEQLGLWEFGHALIETRDLDPIYVALHGAREAGELDEAGLKRYMLAYMLYDHEGVAGRIAEAEDFWREATTGNREGWPRGSCRKRLRGRVVDVAIGWLKVRYGRAENAIDDMMGGRERTTVEAVERQMGRWPMAGTWAVFKMSDMAERLLGWRIDFEGLTTRFCDKPSASARVAAELVSMKADAPTWEVVKRVARKFNVNAPPGFDRRVGVQEGETILCKWWTHRHGKYPVGRDARAMKRDMVGWGELSERIRAHLPECPEAAAR